MLELTTTDNATLGLRETAVKLTLPVIEISCFKANDLHMKTHVKTQLMAVIGEMLDKQLAD